MKKVKIDDLMLWQFHQLADEPGIRHFVSDRSSVPGFEEFTLSFSSHPDRDFIRKNRSSLARAVGVTPEHLFFPSQVHGTRVVVVSGKTTTDQLMETDALITSEPDICIAVMSADCVPILLYDTKNRVVAAVHSGWRGTVQKILSATLDRLIDVYGSQPVDIIAGIGPSVCQEAYEVGGEVVEQVRSNFQGHHHLLSPTKGEKAKLDLWEANRIQLLEYGVNPEKIEISDLCTVKNNSWFFSARKGDKGRFAAGIMLI